MTPIDAELVRVWREGLQEAARRCRAWPAEVRHDAAMESFVVFLEAARRNGAVHSATPHWIGRHAWRHLTRPRRSGRGYHGRPIASGMMPGAALGERVGPDDWLATRPAPVADTPEATIDAQRMPVDTTPAMVELLLQRGWSYAEIARRIRVPQAAVRKWVRSVCTPCDQAVARALVEVVEECEDPPDDPDALTPAEWRRLAAIVRTAPAAQLAAAAGVARDFAYKWKQGGRPVPLQRAQLLLAKFGTAPLDHAR